MLQLKFGRCCVRCEVLVDPKMFPRGTKMLRAMIDAAPIKLRVRHAYHGDCDLLMVYGTGHPARQPWQRKHVAKGGRLIGWDLGYWNRRQADTFTMRCTLDHDHPQAFIRPESPERWDAQGVQLRDDCDPRGPIVVIGMGPKAHRAHGLKPLGWENQALQAARAIAAGRQVVYKPKRQFDPLPAGVTIARESIEQVLRGASLVICRHSNVAVDACIAGVPVVCEDGAAAALYTGTLNDPTTPTAEERLAFLRSLAWWQWTPQEAKQAWEYLLNRINSG